MDYTKLLEVQKKIKPIIKDSNNPFFKSKYADINSVLAEIRPILSECGIIVMQPTRVSTDGRNMLFTVLLDAKSGEQLGEASMLLPGIQDVQKLGAAITYLRRYELVSILALEQEDDDGSSASTTQQLAAKSAPHTLNNPKYEVGVDSKGTVDILQKLPRTLCGHPRRYQQAGTTKAGKPYSAFYPCTATKDAQTAKCKQSIIWAEQAEDIIANQANQAEWDSIPNQ